MPDCIVPWGEDRLVLPIPSDWTVAQIASPQLPAAPPDWADRLAVALTRPEGAEPLAFEAGAAGL